MSSLFPCFAVQKDAAFITPELDDVGKQELKALAEEMQRRIPIIIEPFEAYSCSIYGE